ncbi:E3 ubiquitin-protein ligase KEG-like [Actinidia eriantha]|uniref:E3 ubiquitin-protein ligase KEG-like n=1 Tax=Actinidia eriantha TaxID=165200 RepID=UPI0025863D72|nr:E3 ubiquitin-protein ligase KEG-like [Actinidia eriantha]XP_057459702.1 E3 ubiquitin-protein ligase KEG-like [Actinidia eriantha]XP_057459703.1 E3 ubiquitin-protein ligase KEG-like [Actinidia eriantha]XP_057459705.1 E3 ubiquitin-protein ligase KEG-like [Actinidia eriantha]XP_057459706.1 E3 ubiquitin-protein ligase KEG-like [Actinidia eriantha]XP_057459707.1 E3 ubiquitin-protein ligase KEG-like [Actinidia eriantha]
MSEQIGAFSPAVSFDYELYEGDPDHLRTVVAAPPQISPLIDPASLKLKHRIGRGPFGDVWLATHHQSADDFDEYHEVAVKMLHPIEDHMQRFINKFEELFPKLRGHSGVCWVHGFSILSGKICVAMKFYKGSVGDRMAQLKGGKLPLADVLRYGIDLGKGIQGLHSLGVMVLNLKPSNFLLNDHDQVVLGDFGIPYLLLGILLPPNSDLAFRLGTPNYMAPEQWEPEVRGPITFETDSWGFGCSIVEMLTGAQPWFGMSTEEIYHSVVVKQEKPLLPNGLPPALENIVNGCFEYDLRNRPLIEDVIHAFESSQNAVNDDGEWVGNGSRITIDKSNSSGYSSWFFSKDHLQVGDTVRSRKALNTCKSKSMDVPEGTVVGLEKDNDRDGFVQVQIHEMQNPQRVNASTLERVTSGWVVGDWVHLAEENNEHSSVGILHSIQRDGTVAVGFLGLETLWKGHCSELQTAETYYVGQFVRVKENISTPRFDWPRKRGGAWATGRISRILPNGCLVVRFPGRFPFGEESNGFLADPSQVERVSFDSCPGIVEKYQHVEDFHWAVRPLGIAFGLFTALKLGLFVGRNVGARLKKGKRNQMQAVDGSAQDGQNAGGNSAWLPSPMANILFREGAPTAAAR